MMVRRLVRVAVLAAATAMTSVPFALAQGVPAELPPESFTGDQYVDSRGCIYVRVGVGTSLQWVPRVGRDRQQLCGFPPTFGGAEPVAAAASAVSPPIATSASMPSPRPVVDPVIEPVAPAVRSVATTPRPVASRPRSVATTPRPVPADAGPCPIFAANLQEYLAGPDPRCGPQAVHPGETVRIADEVVATTTVAVSEVREVVRYRVDPPPGYRAAWDDGRMNPYRGLGTAAGQRQMEQVWTNTVPRRLVDAPARGPFAGRSRPAEMAPARLVLIDP